MPLIPFRCECGHSYDELTGPCVSFKPDGKCPKCGSESRTEVIGRFGFGGFQNEHLMDPLEVDAALANRKMHEDMIVSGSRDLGEYRIEEKGPDWTRPFGNNSFDRHQAIAEHNAKVNP